MTASWGGEVAHRRMAWSWRDGIATSSMRPRFSLERKPLWRALKDGDRLFFRGELEQGNPYLMTGLDIVRIRFYCTSEVTGIATWGYTMDLMDIELVDKD